jgi:hypothetical protein
MFVTNVGSRARIFISMQFIPTRVHPICSPILSIPHPSMPPFPPPPRLLPCDPANPSLLPPRDSSSPPPHPRSLLDPLLSLSYPSPPHPRFCSPTLGVGRHLDLGAALSMVVVGGRGRGDGGHGGWRWWWRATTATVAGVNGPRCFAEFSGGRWGRRSSPRRSTSSHRHHGEGNVFSCPLVLSPLALLTLVLPPLQKKGPQYGDGCRHGPQTAHHTFIPQAHFLPSLHLGKISNYLVDRSVLVFELTAIVIHYV